MNPRSKAWIDWHAASPEEAELAAKTLYSQKDKRSFAGQLQRIKQRCKRTGLPFNLTLEDLRIPEICPVLGIEMFYSGQKTDNTPEIDRIVPSKGYVSGNVRRHFRSGE